MRYSVVLRQDEEGNWLASVPALPGCHTWGKSREEALANAREAVEGCVESLRATGEGHISSITFRTGIVSAQHRITLTPPVPQGFIKVFNDFRTGMDLAAG